MFPLSITGTYPCIETCVRDTGNILWRVRQTHDLASVGLMEFPGPNRPETAPRLLCPMTIGGATCLLAFGPRNDGREYSASDRGLVASLADEMPRIGHSEIGHSEIGHARIGNYGCACAPPPRVEGIDCFGAFNGFLELISFEPFSLFISIAGAFQPEFPAAFMVAGIQASLRSLARTSNGKVSKLICELNRMVRELAPRSFLAPLFLGHFDSARQELRYVNAGYQPPLLIKGNRTRALRLEPTAAMLGLTDSAPCWHRTIPLQPRDVFVALPEDCPVSAERAVLDVVLKHREASSAELACLIGQRIPDSPGWPAVVQAA